MKTLTVNNEIAGIAKNATGYIKGLSLQKFTPSLIRFKNGIIPFKDSLGCKSFITFAKTRFFTIFLQAVEIFYVLYR